MSGLLRPHLISLRVDTDAQRQLAEAAGVLNLTVEAYALRLFEAAFYARFGASLDGKMIAAVKAAGLSEIRTEPLRQVEALQLRQVEAIEAPTPPKPRRAARKIAVPATPAPAEPVCPAAPAAPQGHYADLLSPRQIKTVRGYRSAGNSFPAIAQLTGFGVDLCKAACRGMR